MQVNKFLLTIGVIGLVILFLVLTVFFKMKNQIDAFDTTPVDIGKVADGIYEGYSETMMVKVRVRVTVKSGEITDIEILEHECGKGKPAEAMIETMTVDNTVEVDAVSGATASSTVIKDAVRKALRLGLEAPRP